MAVWQYKFTMVPQAGIESVHGCIPDCVESFRGVWDDEGFDPEAELPNYWQGVAPPENFSDDFRSLLPERESWSDDALMFGISGGDQVELWKGDNISVRMDLRAPNRELLDSILNLAAREQLMIVPLEHGRPLLPIEPLVIEDIQGSDAYSFVEDPRGFLTSLNKRRGNDQQTGPAKAAP